jgi:hypothetical protein
MRVLLDDPAEIGSIISGVNGDLSRALGDIATALLDRTGKGKIVINRAVFLARNETEHNGCGRTSKAGDAVNSRPNTVSPSTSR